MSWATTAGNTSLCVCVCVHACDLWIVVDISVIFALYQETHTRAFLLINSLKWIQTMGENHPVQNEI